MKEYNIKVLADNDDIKIMFECDKEKIQHVTRNIVINIAIIQPMLDI